MADRFGPTIGVTQEARPATRECVEEECAERIEVRARLCATHRAEHRAATVARSNAERDVRLMPLADRCAKYGITVADWERMYANQGGCCAICGGTDDDRALAIDHDHATGEVRGLLCSPCNRAIGLLADDPIRAISAADYLAGVG